MRRSSTDEKEGGIETGWDWAFGRPALSKLEGKLLTSQISGLALIGSQETLQRIWPSILLVLRPMTWSI
jgi:hypothetical protein